MTTLTGKTALITGASRGIGRATAIELAAQGANVVLAARDLTRLDALAAEINDNDGSAIAVGTDVTRYDEVDEAVSRALAEYGQLDVLVNNAGTIDPVSRIADSDPDAWGRVIDINLKGVYHALRAALPAMLDAGSGTIVNLSSGAATSALEGWSHYCATKAAVLSLTRCTHREYGDRGIRTIGLSPGTVDTDMQTSIRESGINPVSRIPKDGHIPPEWVARAIVFLCGPGGDEFVGTDFSLKNNEGRERVGLPPVS